MPIGEEPSFSIALGVDDFRIHENDRAVTVLAGLQAWRQLRRSETEGIVGIGQVFRGGDVLCSRFLVDRTLISLDPVLMANAKPVDFCNALEPADEVSDAVEAVGLFEKRSIGRR